MMQMRVAALVLGMIAVPAFAKAKDTVVVPFKTSAGQDAGTATFSPMKKGGVEIKVRLKNLPIGDHAMHIHVNPVCDAPDFKAAGGHFNPDQPKNPAVHHEGDLGKNITIGEQHTGEITYRVDYLSITPGAANSILNRSIMVHERGDDFTTSKPSNPGNRIACAVITAP